MTSHLPSPEIMSAVKEEKDSKKIITVKKEKAKEKKGDMSTMKEEKDSKKIITVKKEKAKEKKGYMSTVKEEKDRKKIITVKKKKAKEQKGDMSTVKEEKDRKKIITVKKKKAKEQKGDDYDDDCYEIDPIDFARKLNLKVSDEVVLVSEKEPVALRDFPHPRHLCANLPFNTSPHKSYCSQCFCYVCEVAAPCKQWEGTDGHCNVSKK